ncbi:DEAD/DEAH box helicase [Fervidibacillus albus]|uniref:DEAD/DEAH box helicase n=1 Tax=Fervidibacillus albus TaxID=2980026 RepID=A0A9E8LV31_9BACI|nr:DEAD/DEAH box helicase [Fervidibacillus albus]WAA09686.1 DEAD/DEAH box helicase [Fervidibacillus albus]
MNNMKPIKISCHLLPNGNFFLYALKDDFFASFDEWVPFLFQWHKETFFGTNLEIVEGGYHLDNEIIPFDGVVINSFQGLSFFATEPFNRFVQWEFDECFDMMLSLAPVIYEKIVNKQWNPTFITDEGLDITWNVPDDLWDEFNSSYWDEDVSDYVLDLNAEENSSATTMKKLTERIFQNGIEHYLQLKKDSLHNWPEKKKQLEKLYENQFPLSNYFDTKRFLEWLGVEQDEKPFSIGLRLEEPYEEGDWWKLEVVLTDKKDRNRTVSYPHPRKGQRMSKKWKAFFDEVEAEIARIGAAFPTYVKEETDANIRLKDELTEDEAWEFLTTTSETLLQFGIDIFLPAWWEALKKANPSLKAKVKSRNNGPSFVGMDTLMNFEWRLAMNGVDISEQQFRRLVEEKRKLVQINGRWMKLDPAFIKRVQQIMEKAERTGVRVQDLIQQELLYGGDQVPSNEQSEDEAMRIQFELQPKLRSFIQNMSTMTDIPRYDVPKRFHGTLRPYQEKGMGWLYFLRQHRFGACLADDMGLGKTIQLIAYLLLVKEREANANPALIICPTSVLGNWQKELERFAPNLRVYLHYGPNRAKGQDFKKRFFEKTGDVAERKREVDGNSICDVEMEQPSLRSKADLANSGKTDGKIDVVLTTYGLAHLDFEELADVRWGSIVLDEAQNIKNADTKQSRAIRKLQGVHHIALTGTPMENRLAELWSIFDFINKGYFGSLAQFQKRFILPIERDHDEGKIEQLQRLIRPFLLRRTKRDEEVELNLPDKLEQKEYCPLTVEQAALYEQLVNDTFDEMQQLSEFERKGLVLRLLGKLKQLCNHPALYLKETDVLKEDIVHRSAKMEKLTELVETILDQGERGLIFTQYIDMGKMIQTVLEQTYKVNVPFLNGRMQKQKRDELIAAFQKGEYPFLLLSLKAGGTGLNLTAANHVIHFDRWWNPAVENQATDRAYRIGQKRFVHVHKFITTGTLEEKIDKMIEKKQALNDEIIRSDQWLTSMNNDELYDLLRLE